jgi:hypothetical protein
VAALASAVAAAVAIPPAREGLKRAARSAVGSPAWRERAGGPREEAFFGRLAASQVGYEMGKRSAEILIARIEDPKRPIEKLLLKAELHVPQA